VKLALQDLSGGADERCALDAGVCAETLDHHLDVDAAWGCSTEMTRTPDRPSLR
jgi:hypothetical protein